MSAWTAENRRPTAMLRIGKPVRHRARGHAGNASSGLSIAAGSPRATRAAPRATALRCGWSPRAGSGHANVDSPSSGSGPLITAGWHTLVGCGTAVRCGVRQWRAHRHGRRDRYRQLDHVQMGLAILRQPGARRGSVPFFGAFGADWDKGMGEVERQSAWDALAGHGCRVGDVGRKRWRPRKP